jgi:hypothetical protein
VEKYSHDILAPEECHHHILIAEREESDDEKPDEIVDTLLAKTGLTTDQLGGVTEEPMVMPTQPIEATTVSHKSGHEVHISLPGPTALTSEQAIQVSLPGPTALTCGQAIQVSLPGSTALASGQPIHILSPGPTALASGQAIQVSLPEPTVLTSGQAVQLSLPGPTALSSGQAINVLLPGPTTLTRDSGYEPTSEQSATTLLPIFNLVPYNDARFGNWGQFNPIQIPNKMLTQYQVPSNSWFDNLLKLPFLQTTDVASTFTQTFPQGPVDNIHSLQNVNLASTFTHACPQMPTISSGVPGQNVLLGTFFFLSASPLPAVPTPSMVHPPLFQQDLPEARDATPQLSLLLHLPVNYAPPTVLSSSQQLAPSPPQAYQPLLLSSNKVTLPHCPSFETSHASSPVLSTDDARPEKPN